MDKFKAKLNLWRLSEYHLHLLELMGGVFGGLVAMILLQHKIKKIKYVIPTLIIFIFWLYVALQYS